MTEASDVLVVGGGIIGLSIAWTLARRGLRVVVLERDRPGQATSAVAGGMLAPLCEAPDMAPFLVDLAFESAVAWHPFAEQLALDSGRDIGHRTDGTLLVAADRDERVQLDHAVSALAERGLNLTDLTTRQIRRKAPTLHPRLAGGYFAPDDHQVDPEAVCRALVVALERQGGTLRVGVSATNLEPYDDHVVVHTSAQDLHHVGHVVVATGATPSPWHNLPLRPVKGQILTLQGDDLLEHVVRTPRIYLVPRAGGRLVVGASAEEMGFDRAPTAGVVMNLLREGWRVLPGLFDARIERLGVGLRPALPDGAPAIGPLDHPRVIAALGHYRHGVLLAAISAQQVADGITRGTPWQHTLLPSRFEASS